MPLSGIITQYHIFNKKKEATRAASKFKEQNMKNAYTLS